MDAIPEPQFKPACPVCGGFNKALALLPDEKAVGDFLALLATYPADVQESIVVMLARDYKQHEHPVKANVL